MDNTYHNHFPDTGVRFEIPNSAWERDRDMDKLEYRTETQMAGQQAIRIFCFPHAGGGPAIFQNWSALLRPSFEVHAVDVTPEQKRSAGMRLVPLAANLPDALIADLTPPFVFFGHSLGALVAFEVIRELRRRSLPLPFIFLVSAFRAPQVGSCLSAFHSLADSELIKKIRRIGGTPDRLLADPNFATIFLPGLRSDFELLSTYAYAAEPPLDVPITVFFGMDDRIKFLDIDAWRFQTTESFETHGFGGGHFFFQQSEAKFLAAVSKQIGAAMFATSAEAAGVVRAKRASPEKMLSYTK